MDSLIPLEEAVDRLGYLHLSTVGRFPRHIGNVLTEGLAKEVTDLTRQTVKNTAKKSHKHWLLYIPGMGRLFWKLYDWLFKVLISVD